MSEWRRGQEGLPALPQSSPHSLLLLPKPQDGPQGFSGLQRRGGALPVNPVCSSGSHNSAEGQLSEGGELVGDTGGPGGRAIREVWAAGGQGH